MQPQPYEIVTRRITTYGGVLAEIPPDAPADLRYPSGEGRLAEVGR
jgi:hypothetical protein